MSTIQQTLDQLRDLRLSSMADALVQQLEQPRVHELGFEERLSLLVDHEWNERQTRKLKRLIQAATLPEQACLEDIDYRASRGLDRTLISSLAKSCAWRGNGCLSCRPGKHEGRSCGHVPVVPVIMSWWHMQRLPAQALPLSGRTTA